MGFSRCAGLREKRRSADNSCINPCQAESRCFDHDAGVCAFNGEMYDKTCNQGCKPCFPESRCGVKLEKTGGKLEENGGKIEENGGKLEKSEEPVAGTSSSPKKTIFSFTNVAMTIVMFL